MTLQQQHHSEPQWHIALEHANAVRAECAHLKAELHSQPPKDGRMLAARMLEQPTGPIGGLRVGTLLMNIWRAGETTVDRWLRAVEVHRDRKVRDLSDRQRRLLVMILRAEDPREMTSDIGRGLII